MGTTPCAWPAMPPAVQFKDVSKADVAVLQLDAGRKVTKDGAAVSVKATDAVLARNRVARAVAKHMQVKAGMGGALYTPDDPNMPVGNCASCHMAKIGKLQDVNVDAQYHLDFDKNGKSAVAEGNVASHVFDIVWPGQSAILKNPDPSKGQGLRHHAELVQQVSCLRQDQRR